MKKGFFMLLILILLLFPLNIKAYDINSYQVNAILRDNGNLEVQEYIDLNGEYNGFIRDILYKNSSIGEFEPNAEYYKGSNINNGTGLELIEIRAVNKSDDFDFNIVNGDLFALSYNSDIGSYAIYEKGIKDGGYSYKMFMPSMKNKAFYLKYIIQNIAVKHNDIGELYWNIIGSNLNQSIASLTAYVNLPNNINHIKAWAHGPLNGNVSIIDNTKIKVSIDGLEAYTPIDVRTTFDKAIIQNSTKLTNVSALEKILIYEQEMADDANEKRTSEKNNALNSINNRLISLENYIKEENYETSNEWYKSLEEDIENLKNEVEYMSLKSKLNGLEKKLIKLENKIALKLVKKAEKKLYYNDYENANSFVKDLRDIEYKTSLLERLKIVNKNRILFSKKMENLNYALIILSFVIMIGAIILYFKKRREKVYNYFPNKYLREIPDDLTPTDVDYLFNNKVSNKAMSATILDLINRNIIKYDMKDKKNIILTKGDNLENISITEELLLDYVFDGNNEVNLAEFKKHASTDYIKYAKKYNIFKTSCEEDAEKNHFFTCNAIFRNSSIVKKIIYALILIIITYKFVYYMIMNFSALSAILLLLIIVIIMIKKIKKSKNKYLFISSFTMLSLIIANLFLVIKINYLNYYRDSLSFNVYIIILLVLSIVLILSRREYSKNGLIEYSKWKAFKNFLNDFSRMNEKKLPEVELWEKYMVYAIVLGCSKKLAKAMNLEVKNNEEFMNTYLLNNDSFIELIDYTINKTVFKASSKATIHYTSKTLGSFISSSAKSVFSSSSDRSSSSSSWGSSSSGSGGGGGFSSGGGSGGGGGGGSRF